MNTAFFDGIEIPLIYSSETSRPVIADRRRTVSGRMRQDIIAKKKQWTLVTRPVPLAARDALYDHLVSIDWQARDFEIEGQTVRAFLRWSRELRSLDQPERRSLNLIATEE